jgi:hypothetical protein
MKKSHIIWFLVIIIIITTSIFLNIFNSEIQYTFHEIEIIRNGNIEKIQILKFPFSYTLINIITTFLYGLATTIFITLFIINQIEKKQKQKEENELKNLQQAININVFDSLFKTIIPSELFDIIKHEIIENKAIRKNAIWDYKFEETSEGKIKLLIINHYELHNISREKIKDPVKLELDPVDGSQTTVIETKCVLGKERSTMIHYDRKNDNCQGVSIKEENNKKTMEYLIEILPNNFIEMTTTVEVIYNGNVNDSHFTKYPIINLDIRATYPNNYTFKISPQFSTEARQITNGIGYSSYKIEGGLLPKQGLIYYLTKNN